MIKRRAVLLIDTDPKQSSFAAPPGESHRKIKGSPQRHYRKRRFAIALLLSACQRSPGANGDLLQAHGSAGYGGEQAALASDASVALRAYAAEATADLDAAPVPCEVGGKIIPYGTRAPAGDGCNGCTCTSRGWLCTLKGCPDPHPRPCGGDDEDLCGDDSTHYCAFPDGARCGASRASAKGVCKSRPSDCTEERAPVCGCDRKTYTNRCWAAHGGTAVLHAGPCSGKGHSCVVHNVSYMDGDTRVPAADGCNTCTCTDGKLACSKRSCPAPSVCGGFTGKHCAEDEYCAYVSGEGCGANDVTSTCRPRPNQCERLAMWVCGCDGTAYMNPCQAARHGVGYGSRDSCDLTRSPY